MWYRFVLFSFIFLFISILGSAQVPKRFSCDFQEVSLNEAFDVLASKYGFAINYAPERVKEYQVTVKFKNKQLEEGMTLILAQVPFRYKVSSTGHVIIIPDPKKDLAPPPPTVTSLRGIITDAETGEPLPYASIGVISTRRGTASNADGFFALRNLKGDSIEIEISHLGYKSVILSVRDLSELENLKVNMVRQATMLEGLILEDLPQSALELSSQAGVARLDPKHLNGLPNLGQSDVFQALQLIPGISATSGTSANLMVRGGRTDQNLILFDDIPLYHLDHFYGIYSALNPLAVQSLKIYKGGFPAQYDGRTSSVIDVKSRVGNRYDATVEANVNLLSANLGVDVPIGDNLVWTATGRIAYNDVLNTPLYSLLSNSYKVNRLDQDQNWVNFNKISENNWAPDFDFYDISSKLTWYASDRDILSTSVFFGGDALNIKLNESFESDKNFENYSLNQSNTWTNNGFSFSWSRQWNDKWYSKTLFSTSDYTNETDTHEDFSYGFKEEPETTYDFFFYNTKNNLLNDTRLKSLVTYQPSDRHFWEFGVEYNALNTYYYEEDLRTDSALNFTFSYETEGLRWSGYIQDAWTPRPGTRLAYGLRLNHYDPGGNAKLYWAPRISLDQEINKHWKFKSAAGVYHQFVKKFQTDRFNTNDQFLWVSADQDIFPVEQSLHVLSGLQWKHEDGWMVDIEAYWRKTWGITEQFAWATYSGKEFIWQEFYGKGTANAAGLDITLHKEKGAYRGWLSYSLGRVVHQIDGLNANNQFFAAQDQRHEINLVQMYTLGNWNFSGTFLLGSGRPYSKPGTLGSTEEVINLNNLNTARLPAFSRVDIAATYGFEFKNLEGNIGASIYNLLNTSNIQYKYFGYAWGEFPADFDNQVDPLPWELREFDVKMLGMTPNIFLNLKF